MSRNKKLLRAEILFCCYLYAVWAVIEGWLYPWLQSAVSNEYALTLLRDGLIKNLVWTLPAFLLIRHFSKELLTDYRKLFSFHRGCWKYLALAVPLAVLVVGGALFRNHGLVLSSSFHPSKLIIALLVGISEESVFRGFLLNADMKRADTEKKQIPAYAVNMVLFLLIHFPIWLREGVFVSSITRSCCWACCSAGALCSVKASGLRWCSILFMIC